MLSVPDPVDSWLSLPKQHMDTSPPSVSPSATSAICKSRPDDAEESDSDCDAAGSWVPGANILRQAFPALPPNTLSMGVPLQPKLICCRDFSARTALIHSFEAQASTLGTASWASPASPVPFDSMSRAPARSFAQVAFDLRTWSRRNGKMLYLGVWEEHCVPPALVWLPPGADLRTARVDNVVWICQLRDREQGHKRYLGLKCHPAVSRMEAWKSSKYGRIFPKGYQTHSMEQWSDYNTKFFQAVAKSLVMQRPFENLTTTDDIVSLLATKAAELRRDSPALSAPSAPEDERPPYTSYTSDQFGDPLAYPWWILSAAVVEVTTVLEKPLQLAVVEPSKSFTVGGRLAERLDHVPLFFTEHNSAIAPVSEVVWVEFDPGMNQYGTWAAVSLGQG